MSNKKLLFGFMAGVAAGIGIYAALKSEKGQDFVAKAKDQAKKWKDELSDIITKGQEVAEDLEEKIADLNTKTSA